MYQERYQNYLTEFTCAKKLQNAIILEQISSGNFCDNKEGEIKLFQ